MRYPTIKSFLIALVCAPFLLLAAGKNHQVMMYSNAPITTEHHDHAKHNDVFLPALLEIQPGDSITFISKEPAHNTTAKKGMVPEGVERWNSPIGEDFTVTLTEPGVYGYFCMPHYSMGMVGLIIVRENKDMPLPNLEEARKVPHPGQAKKAFKKLFDIFDTLEKEQ